MAPKETAFSARFRRALKLGVALAMVLGTLALLDARLPVEQLAHARLDWLLAGLAAWTFAHLAAAARWRFTAQRMGAPITAGFAVAQAYLAALLNQTFPFGVGGDAVRVARHGASLGRGKSGYGSALSVYLIDRAGGQATLAIVTCLTAPHWLSSRRMIAIGSTAALLALALGGALLTRFLAARSTRLSAWLAELRAAWWSQGAWIVQLALSCAVIAGCLGTYFCAARALSVDFSPSDLARIGPLVLTAMALPIGALGFGPREAASTALFAAQGLSPGEGALVAIVYGLLGVVGALPAIPLSLRVRSERRATDHG